MMDEAAFRLQVPEKGRDLKSAIWVEQTGREWTVAFADVRADVW